VTGQDDGTTSQAPALAGRRALAARTADTRGAHLGPGSGLGADEALDAGLVGWIDEHREQIYADLPETPAHAASTHRFFGPALAPVQVVRESAQDRVLRWMGRSRERAR
jgi:hypothetical protein